MTKSKNYKFLDKKTTKEKNQTFVAPLNIYPSTLHLLPLFQSCIIQKVVKDKIFLRIQVDHHGEIFIESIFGFLEG
jgi:hypothetical protein